MSWRRKIWAIATMIHLRNHVTPGSWQVHRDLTYHERYVGSLLFTNLIPCPVALFINTNGTYKLEITREHAAKWPKQFRKCNRSTSFPTMKLVPEEFLVPTALYSCWAHEHFLHVRYRKTSAQPPCPPPPKEDIFTDKVHMSLHTFWDCVAFWNRFIRLRTSRNLRKPSMRLSSKETGVLFLSAWGSLRCEKGSTRKRAFQ